LGKTTGFGIFGNGCGYPGLKGLLKCFSAVIDLLNFLKISSWYSLKQRFNTLDTQDSNMKFLSSLLFLLHIFPLILFCISVSLAQNNSYLTTFAYPVAPGQAFESDKYEVFVKVGDQAEQQLQVLMSDVNYRTMYEGDWMSNELKGRTFSFVHVDYDSLGPGLTFRIVKKFGNSSTIVEISPKSYGYTPVMNGPNEVSFSMDESSKYISVNFSGSENRTDSKSWIRHMLCIFVDPPESEKPTLGNSGVVEYSKTVSASELKNADVIYFPAGYHNLRDYQNPGTSVDADGKITLQNRQELYLEGGAFVEGIVERSAYGDQNQKIFGRGILTGRQYYWRNHPLFSGPLYGQLISVGDQAEVRGILYMESPHHGIVGRKVHIENVKFLGWHCNHDGMRVGAGSEIAHSFSRAVDDHFYNFGIHVHHSVLWAGHNGSIMTYGWGGEEGSNNYGAGASLMEEIDIIHPEWVGLGNNNGLIMSQQGYNHPTIDYGTGSATTVLRNIRMEGEIPAITNLKARSSGDQNVAVQVDNDDVTFLGDLVLENISVESQFAKGVIRGELNPSYNGDAIWYVKDVQFKNIKIAGTCVTEQNKAEFFNQDEATTQNVVFSGCADTNTTDPYPEPNPEPLKDITDLEVVVESCQTVELNWSGIAGAEGYRIRRKESGETFFTNLADVSAETTEYMDHSVTEQFEYIYMVRPLVDGQAQALSNTPMVQIPDCAPVSLLTDGEYNTSAQNSFHRSHKRYNALGQIHSPKHALYSTPTFFSKENPDETHP